MAAKRTDPAVEAALAAYVDGMAKALADLETEVGAARPDLLPLDRSYASIDRVEVYYVQVLAERPRRAPTVADRVARYMGATLIEHAGGRWGPPRYPDEAPCVTGMRDVRRKRFVPRELVDHRRNSRRSGHLREETERHDLQLQRRLLADLTRDVAATLRALRADVKTMTGADPGALTAEPSALTPVHAALTRIDASTPLDLRRRLLRGAIVHVGEVLQARLGPDEWIVETGARNAYLGLWQLHGWTVQPLYHVRDEDGLRLAAESLIEDRLRKRGATKGTRRKTTR